MLAGKGGSWTTRILVILAVVVAYYAGSLRPAVRWHTAVPSSAAGAVSISADGWTYGMEPDGSDWIDHSGAWHDSGRPDCLPAEGTAEAVRFATVELSTEGRTWRPIVLVDCR
jgi:hypothetical protein